MKQNIREKRTKLQAIYTSFLRNLVDAETLLGVWRIGQNVRKTNLCYEPDTSGVKRSACVSYQSIVRRLDEGLDQSLENIETKVSR